MYINSADISSIFSDTSAQEDYGLTGLRSHALRFFAVCVILLIYDGGSGHSFLPNLGD